jgi:hypothetical protein
VPKRVPDSEREIPIERLQAVEQELQVDLSNSSAFRADDNKIVVFVEVRGSKLKQDVRVVAVARNSEGKPCGRDMTWPISKKDFRGLHIEQFSSNL